MNFKAWFEDSQLALPGDPENNALSIPHFGDLDHRTDQCTGKRKRIRSKKAEKLFGFDINTEPHRKD